MCDRDGKFRTTMALSSLTFRLCAMALSVSNVRLGGVLANGLVCYDVSF